MNIVDLFAGGGGASEGIRQALGVGPTVAVNHDSAAIEMHAANHPGTLHLCEDVFRVTPFRPRRKPIDLLWASPNCTHFSRAKGSAPKDYGIRLLAWVVVEWARAVSPRVICLENVAEFLTWGPLDGEGQPIKARSGETFGEFVGALTLAGYRVEWRVLNAADYGAPTSRRRLFLVARRDGEAIRWPEPTHGVGRIPWLTAASCIDWTIPVPSIFDRSKPLAPATERRIAEGVRRYVLNNPRPFLVPGPPGAHPVEAAAWLAKHYGGVVGQALDKTLGTVTTVDHHSLCAASLTKFYGSAVAGQELTEPMPTITSGGGRGGGHAGLVAAFLTKYYGTGFGQSIRAPLDTVTTVDRFGLVTVTIEGEPYVITDIGMRMLQPRELARAQGFADSYILTGNKRDQVARIGNSVCPPVARAVVAAQFGVEPASVAA